MKKTIFGIITALVTAFALATPVLAAAGDAKMTVYDNTSGVTKVVCTTAISPCSITLTAGHSYSFTLQEVNNAQFSNSDLQVTPVAAWSNKTNFWSYNSFQCTSNPFLYSDVSSWILSSRVSPAGTNCVYYSGLNGTASSSSDGSVTSRLDKYPTGYKWVVVNFTTP